MNDLDNSIIKNFVPGTLIYNGNKRSAFSVDVYSYDNKGYDHKTFDTFDAYKIYMSKTSHTNRTIWLNITGINHIDEIEKVGEYYDISDLVLEQILNINKHSSFKSDSEYVFNDLQMVYMKDDQIEIENFSIYHKEQTIITFQERAGDVFDSIRNRIVNKHGYIRDKKSAYLYYILLDVLVDNYLNVLDTIKEEIEHVEIEVINEESINIKKIHKLRKYIMLLKLNCTPITNVVKYFTQTESLLDESDREFMDSLYQHTQLLSDEVVLQKEMVNALYENFMLNNGNEMNKVMTTLTIFSAVFIPLSFLAGIFGMNFKYMPALSSPNGFYFFIVGCVVTAVSMVGFFKLKKWF